MICDHHVPFIPVFHPFPFPNSGLEWIVVCGPQGCRKLDFERPCSIGYRDGDGDGYGDGNQAG
jgi:hypothetical protein